MDFNIFSISESLLGWKWLNGLDEEGWKTLILGEIIDSLAPGW
jgi:hypothetical protein